MEKFRTPYQIVLLLVGLIVLVSMAGAFLLLPASGHLRVHLWKIVLSTAVYIFMLYTITRHPGARRLRYLISTLAVLTVAYLCYHFHDDLPAISLLFLFPIATAVLFWDTATAIFTAVLSTLSHAAMMALTAPLTANLVWDMGFEGTLFLLMAILAGIGVEEWRHRTEQLSALNAIAETVSRSLELDSILSAALDKVLETLQFESGVIYVKNIVTGELEMKQHRGLSEEFRCAVVKGIISAKVADSGKPIIIDDLSQDPNAPQEVVGEGYRAVASIPLLSKGQIQGVLTIASRQSRRFRQQDIDLLLSIGNQIGIAIENARLFEAEQRRAEELAVLNEIGRAVSSVMQLDDLLELISREASRLIDTSNLYIALYDAKKKEISFPLYFEEGQRRRPEKRPAKQGLTEYVIHSAKPLMINRDLVSQLKELNVELIGKPSKSWLGVPLLSGDRAIGVMVIQDYQNENAYNESHLRLLSAIANQAAIAIENARLYEETRRRAEELVALYDVSLVVAAQLDLDTLLKTILSRAIELLNANSGGLYLYHQERQELELIVHQGLSKDYTGTRLALGEGLSGKVAQSGEPLMVDNYQRWEGRSPQWEGEAMGGSLGVPLKHGDDLLGVLYIVHAPGKTFQQGDVRLATLFASQAAVAIENARLYEETQKRLAETTLLHKVAEAINATLDLKEIFQRVVEELSRTFDYRLADIYLLEGEGLRLQANVGYDAQTILEAIPLARGVVGRVAWTGQPAFIRDVSQDPDYIPSYPDITSEICVPIKSGETLLGVLNVECDECRVLTEDDLLLLHTLSSHIGVAIENARLYEEEHRRSLQRKTIAEVGHTIASILDLDTLLSQVVDLIAQNFGYYFVHLYEVDGDTGYAVFKAGTGEAGRILKEEAVRLKLGVEGIIGCVALSGQPLLANDVHKEPRYYFHRALPDTRSELSVPIRVGEKIVGVLDVQSAELGAFDEGDLETLQTLADQLAVAMENARLYQETQRLAITDSLTGLYNLRYFYETLEKEIQRSERYHRSISLIILDIDDLKAYNDLYGHLAGDDLLIELAQLMSKVTRRADTSARYGGDEFAIILPETETEGARVLAQRLLEEVKEHRFSTQNGQTIGRITTSLGVATYPHHADSAKALVDAADKALLRAKGAGKNQLFVCAEDLTEVEPR